MASPDGRGKGRSKGKSKSASAKGKLSLGSGLAAEQVREARRTIRPRMPKGRFATGWSTSAGATSKPAASARNERHAPTSGAKQSWISDWRRAWW